MGVHPSSLKALFRPLPEASAPRLLAEFGYTPSWDLITAEDGEGAPRGRAVCFSPDRAVVVLDRHADSMFTGRLRFPVNSGLNPVAVRQVGPGWRQLAGDRLAIVEPTRDDPELARRQLAWLHDRVASGEALTPQTSYIELERIRDPRRIVKILAVLHDRRATATVRRVEGGPSTTARLDRTHGLLVAWGGEVQPGGPLLVAAEGYNSVFELPWPSSAGPSEAPTEIVRVRRRRERRTPAPPRVTVHLDIDDPTRETVVWPVVDVSVGGLSFRADAATAGLFPGRRVRVGVGWKRGPSELVFDAEVRHCTRIGGGRGDLCGLSLLPIDDATNTAWLDQLAELLHPETHLAPAPEELWDLYCESGYFNLSDKTNDAFTRLKRAFVERSANLAAHPEVGAHFGRRSWGRLEAAASQIEAWTGSWLLFQVARRSSMRPLQAAGDDVLRELYIHAYEHVQHQVGARYLTTYVQDVARFSRLCQLEFGERRAQRELASVTCFRPLEFTVEAVEKLLPDAIETKTETEAEAEVEIEELAVDHPDRGRIAAQLARLYPDHHRRATGLDRPDLRLGAVSPRWRRAGLNRERAIFAARRRGRLEAAMLVEFADDGVHLFGLLDVARFVPMTSTARDCLPALLVAAGRWYAARDKPVFVYFEEQQPRAPVTLEGAVDLGLAYTIALPIESLPELLEHVLEITTTER